MGLSYAPQYTWTDHFAQRAQERFEVNEDSLSKWVGRQIASLTIYDSTVEQRPEEKKYVSDYGVIFVCNTIEQKFITCYEANDWIADGKKITIHDNNVDLFKQEVEKLGTNGQIVKGIQCDISQFENVVDCFSIIKNLIFFTHLYIIYHLQT